MSGGLSRFRFAGGGGTSAADDVGVAGYDPFDAEKFLPPALASASKEAAQHDYNALTAGRSPDNSPVLYPTADPRFGITQQDIDRATNVGFAVSGGGLSTKGVGAGPIRAYHGSPHDFDAFSMDKIGTGEGAQAYGHGLYFAGNEKVAQGYRDTLSGDYFQTPTGRLFDPQQELEHLNVRSRAHSNGSNIDATIELAQRLAASDSPAASMAQRDLEKLLALKAEGGIKRHNGHMYEVGINADPEHFLDWDKPLSEQPHVAERLGLSARSEDAIHAEAERIMSSAPNGAWMNQPKLKARIDELQNELDRQAPNVTGADYYRGTDPDNYLHSILQSGNSLPGRTQQLREAGIPGIKYLDQGSRANVNVNDLRGSLSMWETAVRKSPNDAYAQQQVQSLRDQLAQAESGGTHNYVVFDDKLIDILRKYGWAGLAPAGLAAAAPPNDDHMMRGGLARVPPHFAFGGATGNSPMGFGPSSFQFGQPGGGLTGNQSPMMQGGFNPHSFNQQNAGSNWGGFGNWAGGLGFNPQSFAQHPQQAQSYASPASFAQAPGSFSSAGMSAPSQPSDQLPQGAMNQLQYNPGTQAAPSYSQGLAPVMPGGAPGMASGAAQSAVQSAAPTPAPAPVQQMPGAPIVPGGVPGFASGGMAHPSTPANDPPGPLGLINSPVAGRTDRLPMSVPADSYVIPADVVSGLGQGNTLAGSRILDALFEQEPNPDPAPAPTKSPGLGLAAGGGAPGGVPIITAGGEYMVHPQAVARMGGGDPKKGHQLLDKFVVSTRKQVIHQMKSLAGPKR